jgi:hypothetical protein
LCHQQNEFDCGRQIPLIFITYKVKDFFAWSASETSKNGLIVNNWYIWAETPSDISGKVRREETSHVGQHRASLLRVRNEDTDFTEVEVGKNVTCQEEDDEIKLPELLL